MKIKAIEAQNFQDGTSQRSRALRSLDPDYVTADEQTLADWIRFVQALAKELKFYNLLDEHEGDWTPFFEGDAEAIVAAMEVLATVNLETDNPQAIALDSELQATLSKSQLALFLAFLKLLQYPQQQFQALTQRCLDFYYRQVLRLAEQGSTSDRVHAIFSLASNIAETVLPQGTLLSAGNDSQGSPLQYALESNLYLTQAGVASVKTLSVEKVYIDLETIHQADNRSDRAFENVLRWAIGVPQPGGDLPAFPTADPIWTGQGTFEAIVDLYREIADYSLEQVTELRQHYILYELGFGSLEDFQFCFDVYTREIAKQQAVPNNVPPTELEWQRVYTLIEKAYRKKIDLARRDRLKQEHDSEPDANAAFLKLWQYALGDPRAGDPLPFFQDQPVNLNALLGLLDGSETENVEDAKRYISEQLFLTEADFRKIMDIQGRFAGDRDAPQWEEAYRLLVRAQNRKRDFTYPPIGRWEVKAIHSRSVADAKPGAAISLPRFHPFISNGTTADNIRRGGNFGVAIASTVLQMQEGTREVVATLVCKAGTLDRDALNERLERGDRPFEVAISTATGWLEIAREQLQLAIVDEIVEIPPESAASDAPTEIRLPCLQFTATLDQTEPAIAALPSQESFATPHPILKIGLKTQETGYYKFFKDLCLEKVRISATVQGLQTLQLRSDRASINPKSPFEPFDLQPLAGNSFYFTHPEITAKKLDELTLNLEWMGLPENFATNYEAYRASGLLSTEIDNSSFQARLDLLLDRTWQTIGRRSLFASTEQGTLASQNSLQFAPEDFSRLPTSPFDRIPEEQITRDLRDASRYFRLELASPDFQHALYSLVTNKIASSTDETLRSLVVYPPYTPKLKSISLDYRAIAEINLGDPTEPTVGSIFQLQPFGYLDLQQTVSSGDEDPRYFFLPQYDLDGCLFIGLRDVQLGRSLTLLLQMVSGSGNADLIPPTVEWYYLAADVWHPFSAEAILSDSTNGLLDSGILHLTVPEDATSDNHFLPAGLYWLCGLVRERAAAIPDVIDLRTQAAIATFVDNNNDPERLGKPLTANSINSLVERNAAIAMVEQPYSSFGGRQAETSRAFYTRASERLRHKNRAVTRWDYERLVLERFPQIYKVKCLTQVEQKNDPSAARVTLVVIPNLANTAPFFPLEPKAPQYLLREIEAYMQARTSPFVRVAVKNPNYERIKYRVGVRFHEGYEQGYYLKQLNEELVRFLSPWAYEEQSDISFGSSIHSSAVIHFLETRPYVDYVTNLKLIEQTSPVKDGQLSSGRSNFVSQINTTNLAQVKQADSILVSAPEHIIDFIAQADYTEEEFEGIGYAIIGLDFVVT